MLLRQTLLYLPAQVLGPIFQLISAFAWTHFLLPDQMGLFALISAAQELAFAGTLNWFSLYTVRYFDPNAVQSQKDRFLATETAVLISASLAMVIALLILPMSSSGPLTRELLIAAIAFVVSRSLVAYIADRARTQGDALAYTVLQTGGPMFGFLLGLLLVRFYPPTAATVLWGYTLIQLATLTFAFARLQFSLRPQDGDLAMVKTAVMYGLPLFFGGLLVWLANNGVRFMVEWKEGAVGVGLITVGWALGLRAAQFAAMLTTAAAFPLALKRAREDGMAAGQAQLINNGVLLLATLAPAVAGLYIIGEPLVTLIVAEPYRLITTQVLPLAILTGALRSVRVHFANQVFLLHEKPMIPVMNDGIDAALTIILGGLGLWLGGLTGCIFGIMIGAALTLATGLLAAWHWHKFTFPVPDLLRIGTAVTAMSLAVSALNTGASPQSILLAITVGGLVYAAVFAALYPAAALRAARLLQDLVKRTGSTKP
jgi:O-antigen/teichoic acid export membrane protein